MAAVGVCETCGTPSRDRQQTGTGRWLCQSCHDDLLASSASVVRGTGIGEAVAIRGWLRRVRAAIRGGDATR